jgi:hypothetical protein
MVVKPSENEKVYENRVRRLAERQELVLVKSRRRDPGAPDFGVYWLSDRTTKARIYPSGAPDYGLSLREIEHWLTTAIAVVNMIRRLSASGRSFVDIANSLNEQGLTTQRGQQWDANLLQRILDAAERKTKAFCQMFGPGVERAHALAEYGVACDALTDLLETT